MKLPCCRRTGTVTSPEWGMTQASKNIRAKPHALVLQSYTFSHGRPCLVKLGIGGGAIHPWISIFEAFEFFSRDFFTKYLWAVSAQDAFYMHICVILD